MAKQAKPRKSTSPRRKIAAAGQTSASGSGATRRSAKSPRTGRTAGKVVLASGSASTRSTKKAGGAGSKRELRAVEPAVTVPTEAVSVVEPGGLTDGSEDCDLVGACLVGDEHAYQLLVERYQNRCYWSAFKFVQNAEDALDVVQEAFVKAFRQLASFDTNRRFFTWMYRIVINVAIDTIRRKDVRPAVALDDMGEFLPDQSAEAPATAAIRGETKVDVHRALALLPDTYRTVLALREIEGMSCKEIGEMIDVPHATVRWRLHHARQMFKDVWERRVLKIGADGGSLDDDDADAAGRDSDVMRRSAPGVSADM